MPVIERVFRPNPGPQTKFWQCPARIIGYGGAMGGGKSRAICEKALEYAQTCPGVQILICRQKHTSIVETTRKTMFEEVLPQEMISRMKASGGEDFVDLFTPERGVTSRINFVGLEDPERWFSAQIGVLIVDQVEECEQNTIVKLMTRLRHPKSPVGIYTGLLGMPVAEARPLIESGRATFDGELPDSPAALVGVRVIDYPLAGKVILSFNPENPGHWLQDWFIMGASSTPTGFAKAELVATGADYPFGDAEFFFAKATDNPHLAPGYVAAQLAGMPEHFRRRYLDGFWEFISGLCFFDSDALTHYERIARETRPLGHGDVEGDVDEDIEYLRSRKSLTRKNPIKFRKRSSGPLTVWRHPKPGHRYVMAIDVSSGGSYDYSGIQVVCVEDFEQVAEWQGKADPDIVAAAAYRLGRLYNDAIAAPETTGGWGFSVDQELKRLRYPRQYTRTAWDRLSKKWTDRTGWDTSTRTRMNMLDTLERVIREHEFGLYSLRCVTEMGTFVWSEKRDHRLGKPEAQPGTNDDLVMSLAIAVNIAASLPRVIRKRTRTPMDPYGWLPSRQQTNH